MESGNFVVDSAKELNCFPCKAMPYGLYLMYDWLHEGRVSAGKIIPHHCTHVTTQQMAYLQFACVYSIC